MTRNRVTATELAAAVRGGEISARELIEARLATIELINPKITAITQLADDARAAAAELDARRDRGEVLGPLAGVPITVKESIAVRGLATTHGARFLRDHRADHDAPPVARLRRADAVIIGHSNMPTLTLAGMHTRSELFGSTRNPWDPERTPGGSSGGDAAAVASGLAAIGLGNDSAGSLRLPANFCGVAALKPSTGRYPADHRIGPDEPTLAAQLFPVDGPIAATVEDLGLVHRVLSGADPVDPRALPIPAELGSDGPGRVALIRDPGGVGLAPAVDSALDIAAALLISAGFEVREVTELPAQAAALETFGVLINTEFGLGWERIRSVLAPEDRRYQEFAMARRPPGTLPEYIAATAALHGIRRAWAEFGRDHELVLGPVYADQAPYPDEERKSATANERYGRAMALNVISTCAGLPAVAVPTGLADGLPTGVQLIGRAFREDDCLAAAAVIERGGTMPPCPFVP
ncbi:amidase family protein [Microlunatus speluncae]|uniref:amidase family protein n=1 Tax=Microlunatus speluncae TaxID=2594267 RepID=UPI001266080D|nr:amidase family protein [Microlunatus speluncae]